MSHNKGEITARYFREPAYDERPPTYDQVAVEFGCTRQYVEYLVHQSGHWANKKFSTKELDRIKAYCDGDGTSLRKTMMDVGMSYTKIKGIIYREIEYNHFEKRKNGVSKI